MSDKMNEIALPDGGVMQVPKGWVAVTWETTKQTMGITLIKEALAEEMANKILLNLDINRKAARKEQQAQSAGLSPEMKRYAVFVYDREQGQSAHDHLLCWKWATSPGDAVQMALNNCNPQAGEAFYAEEVKG